MLPFEYGNYRRRSSFMSMLFYIRIKRKDIHGLHSLLPYSITRLGISKSKIFLKFLNRLDEDESSKKEVRYGHSHIFRKTILIGTLRRCVRCFGLPAWATHPPADKKPNPGGQKDEVKTET
jgi:hypothetical protein